jgi:hypothetical protein
MKSTFYQKGERMEKTGWHMGFSLVIHLINHDRHTEKSWREVDYTFCGLITDGQFAYDPEYMLQHFPSMVYCKKCLRSFNKIK